MINELAFLSSIFSTARKDWGMEGLQNPVGGIRKPSPGRPRDRRLEPGEEERLLDEARSYGDGMMHDIIIIA
ncbi:site-specific integrase, partial [Candidatus Parcubacteria bacterium]